MRNINKKVYSLKKSGSVLVFSLFIMMISLIIGVSLMATSSVGRKSTLSSAKSVNSFQVADSGIEYVFRKIREYRWDEPDLNKVLEGTETLRDVFGTGANGCNEEIIGGLSYAVVSGSANGGDYKIYFEGGNPTPARMTACNASFSTIKNIEKIKSVGEYNGISRSVEATVDFSGL